MAPKAKGKPSADKNSKKHRAKELRGHNKDHETAMQRLRTDVALRVLLFVRAMNVCRGCSDTLSALTG
eukprot:7420952-Pyramimonas_sp.AAC.1